MRHVADCTVWPKHMAIYCGCFELWLCSCWPPAQVFDPLLEEKKGKFSKAAQAEKKRKSEWAGRSNV